MFTDCRFSTPPPPTLPSQELSRLADSRDAARPVSPDNVAILLKFRCPQVHLCLAAKCLGSSAVPPSALSLLAASFPHPPFIPLPSNLSDI